MNSRRSGKKPPCSSRNRLRAFLAPALVCLSSARAEEPPRWTDDTAMVAFFQAAREIAANSFGDDTTTVTRITHQALTAYLKETDPYARFLSPEDAARLRELSLPQYAGIALTVTREKSGFLVCFPHPDGPAARAGVKDGDVLVAVDGRNIPEDEPVDLIAARVRGEAGAAVRLSVATYAQETREISVTRAHVPRRTVFATGTNTWRVLSFEPGTPRELAQALFPADLSRPVVLDLRGNPGGSLASAIDCARLFLPAGSPVASVITRKGEANHAARANGPYATWPRLILRQDGATASSAEVFIAALVRNRRAVSAGDTSYGKTETQRTVELVGGAALVLTDGWIRYPYSCMGGTRTRNSGLVPDFHWSDPAEESGASLAGEALMRAYEGDSMFPKAVRP